MVSVIIPSYNTKCFIDRCLQSLLPQVEEFNSEIIIIDSSTDGTEKHIMEFYPSIKIFHFKDKKYIGQARNIGISKASNNIIAFIDADCVADNGWIRNIIKFHNSGYRVVGGAVLGDVHNKQIGWTYYFIEYNRWMPNSREKLLNYLPGCNISYDRSIFVNNPITFQNKFSEEKRVCEDTIFNTILKNSGETLYFSSQIKVMHYYNDTIKNFLLHEVQHGYFSALANFQVKSFSNVLMLLIVLIGPVLPLLKIGMISLRVFRNKYMIKKLLSSFLLVTLGSTCWMFGEWFGFLKGFLGKIFMKN
jgi:glycosyltransferase involved in cell wall biosynthesis